MFAKPQQHGSPERRAFQRFLEWLDEGVDSGGQTYLEMRRRLVAYFDRKNCVSPDDLADETLSRIARRLDEEGAITDSPPARYCYIVARFVFLEYHRQAKPAEVTLSELPSGPSHPEEAVESRSSVLECLERCLRTLDPEQRRLILEYYHGDRRSKIEHRRRLAEQLGITVNAMSIRACRIRDRLETCIRSCKRGGSEMLRLIR